MLRVAGDALYRDAVAAIDRAGVTGNDASGACRARIAISRPPQRCSTRIVSATAAPGFDGARGSFGQPEPLRRVGRVRSRRDRTTSPASRGRRRAAAGSTSQAARAEVYAYASARATWFLGLLAFAQGRLAEASRYYEDTLATFERMGDVEQVAAAHSLLAALHAISATTAAAGNTAERASRGCPCRGRRDSSTRSLTRRCRRQSASQSPEAAWSVQDAALADAREWRP